MSVSVPVWKGALGRPGLMLYFCHFVIWSYAQCLHPCETLCALGITQVSQVWELHVLSILLDWADCVSVSRLTGWLGTLKIMRHSQFIQEEIWYFFSKEGQWFCLKKNCGGMLLLVDMFLEVLSRGACTSFLQIAFLWCLREGCACCPPFWVRIPPDKLHPVISNNLCCLSCFECDFPIVHF